MFPSAPAQETRKEPRALCFDSVRPEPVVLQEFGSLPQVPVVPLVSAVKSVETQRSSGLGTNERGHSNLHPSFGHLQLTKRVRLYPHHRTNFSRVSPRVPTNPPNAGTPEKHTVAATQGTHAQSVECCLVSSRHRH